MADLKAIAEELVNLTVKEVNELATILITVICITLLVWVTLTDANIVKYSRQKER